MTELVKSLPASKRPDISKPRWPQNTYEGRLRHYWATANPLNLFHTTAEIEAARRIVLDYRQKGKVDEKMTVEELWRWKHIYDSAYHPDTGRKMPLIGRMSAQVPCNMIITGGLLTCYQRLPGLVFWHWTNQSFNALVNWTNRSGDSKITNMGLLRAYCAATGGAVTAALGLNECVKNFHPLINRLVPFIAIAVANAINIPLMRSIELQKGIDVAEENGRKLGVSRKVAFIAIAEVTISRIAMAAPYMVCSVDADCRTLHDEETVVCVEAMGERHLPNGALWSCFGIFDAYVLRPLSAVVIDRSKQAREKSSREHCEADSYCLL
uniref:Sidoreflexin n=1 Tax=Ascaris suum TaxID=6253 RepID=F1L865_ASCSU